MVETIENARVGGKKTESVDSNGGIGTRRRPFWVRGPRAGAYPSLPRRSPERPGDRGTEVGRGLHRAAAFHLLVIPLARVDR